MKRLGITVCLLGLLATACFSQDLPAPKTGGGSQFKTTKDKASYGIGLNIGRNIQEAGLDVNLVLLLKGLSDAIENRELAISERELNSAIETFERDNAAAQVERQKAVGEKNKRDGQAFLAANKSKTGVQTLPSGLQYKVLKSGTGASPKVTDTVSTHYRGTLIDGTVFDSSYESGQAVSFPVGGVIRGWTEALQRMKVGDKWQLFIPSELAYGPRGAGRLIGPDAVLIFELELLSVENPAQ
jgi:FKBP-type peptidyl-prolyl cis-trans isomerase FklB